MYKTNIVNPALYLGPLKPLSALGSSTGGIMRVVDGHKPGSWAGWAAGRSGTRTIGEDARTVY